MYKFALVGIKSNFVRLNAQTMVELNYFSKLNSWLQIIAGFTILLRFCLGFSLVFSLVFPGFLSRTPRCCASPSLVPHRGLCTCRKLGWSETSRGRWRSLPQCCWWSWRCEGGGHHRRRGSPSHHGFRFNMGVSIVMGDPQMDGL